LDFSFHFIHCQDIAAIVKYLLEHRLDRNEYVLGNEPLTIGDFLRQAAAYFGLQTPFQIRIPMGLIQFLTWLKRGHSWDQYCLKYRHFVYDTVNCPKLGLPTSVNTVKGILETILPQRGSRQAKEQEYKNTKSR
jgi:nucleoside-diphosphate-sugar epimerase